MKIAIMQPYFVPYIGYFQLISAVNKYVIYDDVNFISKGWVNRNNILLNGERHLINLLLLGASQNKIIKDIKVQPNQNKLFKVIENAYKKAPYFDEIFPVILRIIQFENRELGQFLWNSISELCRYMLINTELILSSTIIKDNSLKSQAKILHICEILGTEKYFNSIGGQALYNKDDFKKKNIELEFLDTLITPYPQFKNDFVPSLSIIDVLMFNSLERVRIMLNEYKLV